MTHIVTARVSINEDGDPRVETSSVAVFHSAKSEHINWWRECGRACDVEKRFEAWQAHRVAGGKLPMSDAEQIDLDTFVAPPGFEFLPWDVCDGETLPSHGVPHHRREGAWWVAEDRCACACIGDDDGADETLADLLTEVVAGRGRDPQRRLEQSPCGVVRPFEGVVLAEVRIGCFDPDVGWDFDRVGTLVVEGDGLLAEVGPVVVRGREEEAS
jgi:hypothetical protein